jgi:ATP-binding cassette subfamily B protein
VLGIFKLGLRVARWPTILAVVVGLVGAATAIILPLLTGQAIGRAPDAIRDGLTQPYLTVLIGLLVTLAISNISGVLGQAGIEIADGLVRREVSLRIGWSLSHEPELDRLEDPPTADLVQKVRSREWEVSMGFHILTAVVTRQIPALVGTAISLGIVLTWWAPLPILIMIGLNAEYIRRVINDQMDIWSGQTEGLKHASYAFEQGMGKSAKEIRIFGLADFLRGRMIDFAMSAYRPYWAKRWRDAAQSIVLGVVRVVATIAVIGYASWQAATGQIDLTTFATAIPLIMAMADTDLWMFGQLQRAGTTYGWLEEIAPTDEYLEDAARVSATPAAIRQTQRADVTPPRIVFDDVSFSYPRSDKLILENLTFELPAGEAVALVGVNGAGKSTLVKLLTAGYLPTRGRILIDGVDLASLEVEERRSWQRRVAPITQDFLRLPLPAGDNVELGTGEVWAGRLDPDPLPDTTALDAVGRRAGITELIKGLPSGWATSLDKTMPGGTDLSGGEWQRIGLARALRAVTAGAQVLVLDEPAAALDVESEARLVDGYLDLARSVTSLIISHRFSVVRPVPTICVLEHGRIIERGSHEELMAMTDGRYRAMFSLQASRYAEAEEEAAEAEVDA